MARSPATALWTLVFPGDPSPCVRAALSQPEQGEGLVHTRSRETQPAPQEGTRGPALSLAGPDLDRCHLQDSACPSLLPLHPSHIRRPAVWSEDAT